MDASNSATTLTRERVRHARPNFMSQDSGRRCLRAELYAWDLVPLAPHLWRLP